jgi:predicted enzyme related to lactoylglutathione lyase
MGNPIVHFEVIGPAPDELRTFYRDLFDWEFDTSGTVSDVVSEPTNYGFVEPGPSGVAVGVGGGEGYPAKTVVYVGVPDVEVALQRAESLGGIRVIGPARRPDGQLVIGQFADPQGNLVGVAGPA